MTDRRCRPHHPPFAAQALLPEGHFITVQREEGPDLSPFLDSNDDGSLLSVIRLLGTDEASGFENLDRFLDWAGQQPPEERPVYIEGFHLADGRTGVAYATRSRIEERTRIDPDETTIMLRQIVQDEAASFQRKADGELYRAELRRACAECGQPAAGEPIYTETEIEGPPEEAIRLMREILYAETHAG